VRVGLRSATGNRVPAERWVAGSNPALSVLPVCRDRPCTRIATFELLKPALRVIVAGQNAVPSATLGARVRQGARVRELSARLRSFWGRSRVFMRGCDLTARRRAEVSG